MPVQGQIKTVHFEDPASIIWGKVGDISGFDILFQKVLIGLYIRPATKTLGGVIVPEKVVDEDEYQSKCGLVLKLGRRAFLDDPEAKVNFRGAKAKVGDWVVFRQSNGTRLQVGDHKACFLVSDVHIDMVVPHPDAVY